MALNKFFKQQEWALNHAVEGWTLHSLSQNEVKAILATVPDKFKSDVRVWKKGWPAWADLKHPDCRVLLELRIEKREAPPLPHQLQHIEFEDESVTQVKSSVERLFVQRKYKRYDITLPVTVILGSNQFKTQTRDLSLGGVCLADPLPDWVAGYCTVVLDTPDNLEIELVCTLVEDQKMDKFRLEIVQSLKYEELKDWMSRHNFL